MVAQESSISSCSVMLSFMDIHSNLSCSQYEDLVASPLMGYALSLNVLIRQINLAQSWREWLLSTIAVDYLIFLIRTNGIRYVNCTDTEYRVWE